MTGSSICATYHMLMIIEWKLEIVNIVSNRHAYLFLTRVEVSLSAIIRLDLAPLFRLPFEHFIRVRIRAKPLLCPVNHQPDFFR